MIQAWRHHKDTMVFKTQKLSTLSPLRLDRDTLAPEAFGRRDYRTRRDRAGKVRLVRGCVF